MRQDKTNDPLNTEPQKILQREARKLAREFNVDATRVRAGFDRLIALWSTDSSLLEIDTWIQYGGWRRVSQGLRGVEEILGPEAPLNLFEQADLAEVFRRDFVVRY